MTSLLPYETWIEEALRDVVHRALSHTAAHGLPGHHHFYITVAMEGHGVDAPAWLRAQYPTEMTIVLQHQFWDLQVAEDVFGVTLRFHGREARITVPFRAVVAFGDPAVNFGLQLRAGGAPFTGQARPEGAPDDAKIGAGEPGGQRHPHEPGGPAEVVTLDSFRKK